MIDFNNVDKMIASLETVLENTRYYNSSLNTMFIRYRPSVVLYKILREQGYSSEHIGGYMEYFEKVSSDVMNMNKTNAIHLAKIFNYAKSQGVGIEYVDETLEFDDISNKYSEVSMELIANTISLAIDCVFEACISEDDA